MNISVALNYVEYLDLKKRKYQENALFVLEHNKGSNVKVFVYNYPDEKVNVPSDFIICKSLKRDPVKDFGAERRLPYIKEILDLCVNTDCDVFGYINSDILIPNGFFNIFKENRDVYLFSRTDIGEVNYNTLNENNFRIVWNGHPGCDGFFFKKEWWINNSDKFDNDLIIGEPKWDDYYMVLTSSLTENYISRRAIYHTWHDTIWSELSIGGKHNTAIWNKLRKNL